MLIKITKACSTVSTTKAKYELNYKKEYERNNNNTIKNLNVYFRNSSALSIKAKYIVISIV